MYAAPITPVDQPSVEDRIRAVRAAQEADRQITPTQFMRQIDAEADRLFRGRTTRIVRGGGQVTRREHHAVSFLLAIGFALSFCAMWAVLA
jgi:hypothetical protein